MNIELKPFESGWFTTRSGNRAHVTNSIIGGQSLIGVVDLGDGESFVSCWSIDGSFLQCKQEHTSDLVEFLPDCTGWDWNPNDKVRAMADTLRRCGIFLHGCDLNHAGVRALEEMDKVIEELEAMDCKKKGKP